MPRYSPSLRNALLSLDGKRRRLVLPQLNVPGFVNSPWEALYFWRIGWGWVRDMRGRGEQEKEWKRKLWMVCEMNKKKVLKKMFKNRPTVF